MAAIRKPREPSPIPPAALEAVERWCVQIIPETDEEFQRLIAKSTGSAITILEAHIPSDPQEGTDWIIQPFAQLRYDRDAGRDLAWSLYFANPDTKWQEYGTDGLTGPLKVLLDEIEDDPYGIFQWIDVLG